MPTISIEFDDEIVSEQEALDLSNAVQKVVSSTTQIDDTFVYANSAQIKVKVAPVEIWIQLSDYKIDDMKELNSKFAKSLSEWKRDSGFSHKINMTLIPMHWDVKIDI